MWTQVQLYEEPETDSKIGHKSALQEGVSPVGIVQQTGTDTPKLTV